MVFLKLCEICSESGLIRSGGAFCFVFALSSRSSKTCNVWEIAAAIGRTCHVTIEHFSQHTLPRGFVCPVRTLLLGGLEDPSNEAVEGTRAALLLRICSSSEVCDQKLRDAPLRKMFDFGSNIFDVCEKPALTKRCP